MTRPPSGQAAPTEAWIDGGRMVSLFPLAFEICRRYREDFPDEQERYGDAGIAWCHHDNQYLLLWAIQEVFSGTISLQGQVAWLAGILAARDFPLPRLARDLEIASEVVAGSAELGDRATQVAATLARATQAVDEVASARQPR